MLFDDYVQAGEAPIQSKILINHLKIIFLWRTLTLCSRITKLTQKEISQQTHLA